MAKKGYIGIGDVAHKIKKGYIGIGGIAHKVKKGYIGVNGVAQQFYSSGGQYLVGGRIFYIHSNNGATYTFYDVNGNELPTQTVVGLANAYSYDISGTPSADKFYVYDSTNGLISSKEWGAYGTYVGITTDGIGLGKTNTATALANSACFTPYISGRTTMWKWLRDNINANNVGGYNDWFIGSKAEQDQLRNSGLVDWYSNWAILSSVEYSDNQAYVWYSISNAWYYTNKGSNGLFVTAFRAF